MGRVLYPFASVSGRLAGARAVRRAQAGRAVIARPAVHRYEPPQVPLEPLVTSNSELVSLWGLLP
jgi:hypothetical protein